MFKLIEPLPRSPIDPVNEVLHGITVTDPYRWLEDSESAQTRSWLEAQTKYGRAYLDSIPGREHICKRVRELLDVETYDSLQKVGRCYFFRKRLCGQEQPCIFMREGRDGEDCLLIDPRDRLSGKNVAVKPIRVSPDGRLLLYEVKEGGTRSGAFEFFDIQNRRVLSDILPRGCLRGFSFAPHSRSFYYVHEPSNSRPQKLAVREHVLGAPLEDDRQIFLPDPEDHLRLHIVPGKNRLGFLVYHFLDKPYTDF
jgi:prolyl oligopeptidase